MASEQLLEALESAFGSAGPGVPPGASVVQGKPGKVLSAVADRPDDLLVIGAGERGRLRRAMWPSVARYRVARAGCPVLAVPSLSCTALSMPCTVATPGNFHSTHGSWRTDGPATGPVEGFRGAVSKPHSFRCSAAGHMTDDGP
ncbi:universal stress protein [Streptomyces sp. NPDC048506]|uniref:universal stress protein n=1 Tax=Streptomyces sp. NPDC048506 TaxID=3155028 RepID=UPI003413F4E1